MTRQISLMQGTPREFLIDFNLLRRIYSYHDFENEGEQSKFYLEHQTEISDKTKDSDNYKSGEISGTLELYLLLHSEELPKSNLIYCFNITRRINNYTTGSLITPTDLVTAYRILMALEQFPKEGFPLVDSKLIAFCEEFMKRYPRNYREDFNRDLENLGLEKRSAQERRHHLIDEQRNFCSGGRITDEKKYQSLSKEICRNADYIEVRAIFLDFMNLNKLEQVYFSPPPKEIAERLKAGICKLKNDWKEEILHDFDRRVDNLITSTEKLVK